MTSTAPLTGIIQLVYPTIHFLSHRKKKKEETETKRKTESMKNGQKLFEQNTTWPQQIRTKRTARWSAGHPALDIQHSLPHSADKWHNDTTMKTRWQHFQDMHHVHTSLDPNAKFGSVKHSSAQDARKLSCIESTAAAEITACLPVSFHHETPLCTDGSSSYLENIIIVIMYSFRCYFSKLEHIAHYKAKNQTQSKQTSASTRTPSQ